MTKTVYTEDLDLDSSKLESIYPDKTYVRHGGRNKRAVHHLDGSTSMSSSVIWKEITVTRVWVECIENSDEIEVKKAYELHLLLEGGEIVTVNLTAKQYGKLTEYKYTKPAAELLTKILRKEGKGLLIRKLVATKKFSFRANRKVAELIEINSRKCGISAGEYISRCCSKNTPREALTEEEVNLLKEFAKGRQDFQFFFNMLTVWREGKTKEQIASAVIMGENFAPLRKRLASIMQEWDETLGKLLNRQIE